MPEAKNHLRLIVASPSDVPAEREAVAEVVALLNQGVCADRGVWLVAYRWEVDTYAAFHPRGFQHGVIDPVLKLGEADVVIGIFRARLGTSDPRLGGNTGTQYEIGTALARLRGAMKEPPPVHVAVYHDVRPDKLNWRNREARAQREGMYAYFDQLERDEPGFIAEYEGPEGFRQKLLHDLQSWICSRFELPSGRRKTSAGRRRALSRAQVLVAYHEAVRVEHDRPLGLFNEHLDTLDQIFIELDLDTAREGGRAPTVAGEARNPTGSFTLRQLLTTPPRERVEVASEPARAASRARIRWVVLGHPGAGKSTLARHLAWELAREHLVDGGGAASDRLPIGLYASLPALAVARQHPFEAAERALCESRADGVGQGLRDVLTQRARETGAVWLLLDGLDELTPEQRPWVDAQLAQWASDLEHSSIAVFSRLVGFVSPGPSFRAEAHVRPLDAGQQRRLLEKWLDPTGRDTGPMARLQTQLDRSAALREACAVPLLLSLLAFLSRSGTEHPRGKRELYALGLKTLLERGHHAAPSGVRDPGAARTLLGELSLALQDAEGEAWPVAQLERALRVLSSEAQALLHSSWRNPGAFLEEIAQRSGVLAPHDGQQAPWRFLHRQLRELLAAEALDHRDRDRAFQTAASGPGLIQRAQTLSSEQLPRWAEVCGFACELSEDPLKRLRELAHVSQELAFRVLPELEGVDPIQALGQLAPGGHWDGDFLLLLFERWREQGTFHLGNISSWLWSQVSDQRSTSELAALHYALCSLGVPVERARFFRGCGRWLEGGSPALEFVAIEKGEFRMEWAEDEPESKGQHLVRLSAFQLGATAVTNAQYAVFDPTHESETFGGRVPAEEGGQHPVVNVSWWEAYLYCAWAGARLPTEAEWEYGCRAGTQTFFSFGDLFDSRCLNTREAGRRRTVEVGSLCANPWGLFEMHGNVFEWCSDRQGNTRKGPMSSVSAGNRVYRGGSWIVGAQYSRSAFRSGSPPGYRDFNVGFRPARDLEPVASARAGIGFASARPPGSS